MRGVYASSGRRSKRSRTAPRDQDPPEVQEIDILADGTLDQDDDVLEEVDVVVVAVHSRFDLPASEQTARVLAALRHRQVDILAHPTGRLINRRPPFDLQIDEVLHCAKENGVVVELNAHPERLDLKDNHLMLARELGLKVAISTDAHRVRGLDLMHYGVEQARRAWLSKAGCGEYAAADRVFAAAAQLARRA